MRKIASAVKTLLVAEDGPTAVEYAILLSFIIMVCFAAIITVGAHTNSMFVRAGSALP